MQNHREKAKRKIANVDKEIGFLTKMKKGVKIIRSFFDIFQPIFILKCSFQS